MIPSVMQAVTPAIASGSETTLNATVAPTAPAMPPSAAPLSDESVSSVVMEVLGTVGGSRRPQL